VSHLLRRAIVGLVVAIGVLWTVAVLLYAGGLALLIGGASPL
jgi:hypothetical protein